jgi:hypothetical protein
MKILEKLWPFVSKKHYNFVIDAYNRKIEEKLQRINELETYANYYKEEFFKATKAFKLGFDYTVNGRNSLSVHDQCKFVLVTLEPIQTAINIKLEDVKIFDINQFDETIKIRCKEVLEHEKIIEKILDAFHQEFIKIKT